MRTLVQGRLALLVACCLGLASAKPFNIVFAMADQLRTDALGAYGNTAAHTPHLDHLAQEGVLFRHMYTSTPTCTPARAAILTGQSPWNHGMLGYGAVADRYPVELPRVMASAGFRTASFGKDHFGWNATTNEGISHGYQVTQLYDGLGSGFQGGGEYDNYDQWFQSQKPGVDPMTPGVDWNSWRGKPYAFDEFYHPTAWVGREAVDYIHNQSASAGEPFFMKVSFHRPHSPYDPPQRVLDTVAPYSEFFPIQVGQQWDNMFIGGKGHPSGCGPTADAWCGKMPDDQVELARRCYFGSVSFVDEWIGEIMRALNDTGLLENTWVIFTADHGDMQGDHYHWRKGFPYKSSANIPLIVRWPTSAEKDTRLNITAQRASVNADRVVELRDVLPTVLDIANVPLPQGAKPRDGKPWTCLLNDPSGVSCDWRAYLDLEHSTCYNETNHWNALTDGRMKYIFNAFFPQEQLFDLVSDPFEHFDLSQDPEHASTLALWRQRMVDQFERENRGPQWVKNGQLMQRTQGQTYSPNFPKTSQFANGVPVEPFFIAQP